MRKKAMSSEKASFVKKEGHRIEKVYASWIGGKTISGTEKPDVIDKKGNIHSVKGAKLKWQMFLYVKRTFLENFNVYGNLFADCIDCFPKDRADYLKDKMKYKEKLKEKMKTLKEMLDDLDNRKMFFMRSISNNQIKYFVVYDREVFHVFDADESISKLSESTIVLNSKARTTSQMDNQKVVFKYNNKTIGEIEMRNDSDVHYRQVKLWIEKEGTMKLLKNKIPFDHEREIIGKGKLLFYGKADDSFLN